MVKVAFGKYETWDKKKVVDWILSCRRDEGVPMFKTKFGGVRFKVDGEPATMAICWGGLDGAPSVMFTKVPESDIKLIEEGIGDWRKILSKYGTESDIEKALSYGIYIKGSKLPRIVRK